MSEVFLLGHPVSHSLSPAMHNAAFKALGLPHKYSTRDVAPEKLADVVASLRGETALGANVTIPHKENALRLMDSAAEEARRVGAVNTIVRRGSRLVGENTDKHGFLRAVQAMRGSSDDDLRIGAALVLGAGGAARACILALLENGNDVLVANRERSRAETGTVAECRRLGCDRETATECNAVARKGLLLRRALSDGHPRVQLGHLFVAPVFPANVGVERERIQHRPGAAVHVLHGVAGLEEVAGLHLRAHGPPRAVVRGGRST